MKQRNVTHDLCQKGLHLRALENWKWKIIATKQQGLEEKKELELEKRGLGAEAVFQERSSVEVEEKNKVETAKWGENRKDGKEWRRHQVPGKSDSNAVGAETVCKDGLPLEQITQTWAEMSQKQGVSTALEWR